MRWRQSCHNIYAEHRGQRIGAQITNDVNTEKDNLTATARADSPAPTGYAEWDYHASDGVNMWTWRPERGLSCMVTQHADNIQAHVTTGTAHKFCRTIGSYATVKEAKARCEEHRHTAAAKRQPGNDLSPQ